MATGLSISRILLESAIDKLNNLLETKKADHTLTQAEQLIRGGIFRSKQTPKNLEVEAIVKLLTQACVILKNEDDFDEVEANQLREQINKIT